MHISPNRLEKNYPARHDIDSSTLDQNSSLWWMLQMVGRRKDVLDVGCATGYLAKLMTANDCSVVGVEANNIAAETAKTYCARVFVADLDFAPLSEVVDGKTFDVMVFGDVLEHLRHPVRLLDEARTLLRADGYIVASIPNVAHGAIRLALLEGQFNYSEVGVLDDTHLRFFTLKTIKEMFLQSGFEICRIERTKVGLFDESNLVPNVSRHNFSQDVITQIEGDPECETLQFILQARPFTDAGRLEALAREFVAANTELASAKARLARMDHSLTEISQPLSLSSTENRTAQQSDFGSTLSERDGLKVEVSRLHSAEPEIQKQLIEQQAELHRLQMERDRINVNLATVVSGRDELKVEIVRLQSAELESRGHLLEQQAELHRLQAERDRFNVNLVTIVSERDGLKIELDHLQSAELETRAQALEQQAELERLKMERDDLNGNLSALERGMSAVVSERDGLKVEIASLQSAEFESKARLLEQEAELQRLQTERDRFNVNLGTIVSERDGLKIEMDRLQSEELETSAQRLEQEAELQRLQTERESLSGHLADLERGMRAIVSERDGLKVEIDRQQAVEADTRGRLLEQQADLQRLQMERESLSRHLADLERGMSTVVSERDGLKVEIDRQQSAEMEIRWRLLEQQSELKRLQMERDSLSGKLADLEGGMSAVVSERNGFKAEVERLHAAEGDLRERALERLTEISQIKADLSSAVYMQNRLRAKVDRLNFTEANLRERLQEGQSRFESLLAERDSLAGQLVKMEMRLNELSADHEQTFRDVDRLISENVRLTALDTENKTRIREGEDAAKMLAVLHGESCTREAANVAQIAALEAEWYDLAEKEFELRNDVVDYQRQIANQSAEKDNLESRFSEMEVWLSTLIVERDSLVDHLRVSGDKLNQTQTEIDHLRNDLRSSESERDRLVAQASAQGNDLEELASVNKSLLSDLDELKGRLLLQTDLFTHRARCETQALSKLIESVQSSKVWKLKKFLAMRR